MHKGLTSAVLATTLAASFALEAGGSCCDPCETSSCASTPCCFCYNPPVYNLECAWGITVQGSFLYWYGQEGDLIYAQKGDILSPSPRHISDVSPAYYVQNLLNLAPLQEKCIDKSWAPGWRASLGINTECDGWGLIATWTYYKTDTSKSTSIDPGGPGIFVGDEFLISPWVRMAVSPDSAGLLNTVYFPYYLFSDVKGKWSFELNDINLVLGRRFWVSPSLSIDPYIGLEGAWTKTTFRVQSSASFAANTTLTPTSLRQAGIDSLLKDSFKNEFSGVGPVLGLASDWGLGCGFSIFGDFSFSLLQGDYKRSKIEDYQSLVDPSTTGLTSYTNLDIYHKTKTSTCFGMQPILDLELGLRFQRDFCNCRYRFGIDASWEQQYWFNHTTRIIYSGIEAGTIRNSGSAVPVANFSYSQNFNKDVQDVILGGLRVGIRFDF